MKKQVVGLALISLLLSSCRFGVSFENAKLLFEDVYNNKLYSFAEVTKTTTYYDSNKTIIENIDLENKRYKKEIVIEDNITIITLEEHGNCLSYLKTSYLDSYTIEELNVTLDVALQNMKESVSSEILDIIEFVNFHLITDNYVYAATGGLGNLELHLSISNNGQTTSHKTEYNDYKLTSFTSLEQTTIWEYTK